MKSDQVHIFISEFTSILRELKLNSLDGENPLKISSPKRKVSSYILNRKTYNKLSEFNKLGGIIGGSRALKYYTLNGVPLLNRDCDDWDIILSKDSLFKFCANHNLSNIMYDKEVITLNVSTGFCTGTSSYSDKPTYLFRHDFDILSTPNMPQYVECDGYKISTLQSILHEKIELVKADINKYRVPSDYSSKHLTDCIEIMVKFTAYFGDRKKALLDTFNYSDIGKTLESMKDVLEITENE